jgi:hypothetical protein
MVEGCQLGQQFDEFLPKARSDPAWLITCLQDTQHNLTAYDKLTCNVRLFAANLGCMPFGVSVDYAELKPLLVQWLIEMQTSGDPVTYDRLKKERPYIHHEEPLLFHQWKKWLQTIMTTSQSQEVA